MQVARAEEDDVFGAEHHAREIRTHHERVQRGQLMVDPTPGEAHSDHQRGQDVTQRLVEIRAVLFRDPMLTLWWDLRPRRLRDRIHIADHRLKRDARSQDRFGPAVGGNTGRRKCKSGREIPVGDRPRAHKGHWFRFSNNFSVHLSLTPILETEHIVATK